MERGEEAIPPGMVYDDFLTALTIFDSGLWPDRKRKTLHRDDLSPERAGDLRGEDCVREEEEKRRRTERVKDGKDFLVRLSLDPQVTHSKEGAIEGWLSRDSLPSRNHQGCVLFGDVKGTLVKKT